MKPKSRPKGPLQDADNQPYHHPILEEQMIIRFPQDIAARLSGAMEDDNFEAFKIKFTDKHHATVKIFGERLNAVLLSLPTIVETHRTVDGSHLFKSADIGEILIVYRPSAEPSGILDDFRFEHGLTPPTTDIVSKRRVRQESVKNAQGDSNPLEGINYWEMVEIQLAALLSKDKTAKPICRHEFMEEPDVDPVILEKLLRRAGRHEFKGYSGQFIDEADIDKMSPENEPIVKIPQEILRELAPKREPERESDSDFDLGALDEVEPEAEAPTEEAEQHESSSEEADEEEEEEEASELRNEIAKLSKAFEHAKRNVATARFYVASNSPNEYQKARNEQNLKNALEFARSVEEKLNDALRKQENCEKE
jgi:transcription initiation factor TFIID subunit 7